MLPSRELPLADDGEADWSALPDAPGVVAIEPAGGRWYLARTRNIRKRLARLLRADIGRGRTFSEAVSRVLYEPAGSIFEARWRLYRAARRVWPEDYRSRLRLRPPACLRLHVTNPFPRLSVARRLGSRSALYFGPFAGRAPAENAAERVLDFFGVRRCVENLAPDPAHPGCVHGEVGKCLRPCQTAVTVEEYRAESGRLAEALHTRGAALAAQLEAERDRAMEELEFERAQKLHAKLNAARELFRSFDEMCADLDRLHGVVVQRAYAPDTVALWPVFAGSLGDPVELTIETTAERPQPLDRRVRELLETAEFRRARPREREDHLALLASWRYGSWREGELVVFDGLDRVPYRKLVNAIARTAARIGTPAAVTAAMRARQKQAARAPSAFTPENPA